MVSVGVTPFPRLGPHQSRYFWQVGLEQLTWASLFLDNPRLTSCSSPWLFDRFLVAFLLPLTSAGLPGVNAKDSTFFNDRSSGKASVQFQHSKNGRDFHPIILKLEKSFTYLTLAAHHIPIRYIYTLTAEP
jgi:hypothetical protein